MANTLNLGNGNWATKEDSLLAYNSENGNFKPLPFDFTRASSATVVNKDGLIETVGSGEPRIDFSNDAKGALLLEPTRTNTALQSNKFDTTWINTNSAETSGQVGVGGSTDAWLLNKSAANGHIKQNLSSSGIQTLSVFAKKGSLNWIRIIAIGGTSVPSTWFDLENGVVGAADFSTVSSSIENYGNGWYRCSITIDVGTITGIRYYPSVDNNNVSGTSGNIYIQNAQLEQGSYATSYIPTSGSAITRSADACNNAGSEQVINSTEGVLYFKGSVLDISTPNSWISVSQSSSYTNNQFNLRFVADSNLIQAVSRANGLGNDVVLQYTLSDKTTINKIAIKYKLNDWALWVNGIEVDTETSSVAFTSNSLDVLDFDRGNNSNNFYGNTKDLRVYNTALTDAELQALTT